MSPPLSSCILQRTTPPVHQYYPQSAHTTWYFPLLTPYQPLTTCLLKLQLAECATGLPGMKHLINMILRSGNSKFTQNLNPAAESGTHSSISELRQPGREELPLPSQLRRSSRSCRLKEIELGLCYTTACWHKSSRELSISCKLKRLKLLEPWAGLHLTYHHHQSSRTS